MTAGSERSWALLAGLNPDHRQAVLARCQRRRYDKGETLFHAGDLGATVHLLVKGWVAVRVGTPQGDTATFTVLGPGDMFGEQALLQPSSRRTASVVALAAVETLTLDRADFDELRDRHPGVERALVDLLAAQVRRLSLALADALYLPADKRVLRRLADLCVTYGAVPAAAGLRPPVPGSDPGPVEIPLTQDDLATMAGTTRPTVNRVLRSAVAAGYVALHRGRIVVLDVDRLRSLI